MTPALKKAILALFVMVGAVLAWHLVMSGVQKDPLAVKVLALRSDKSMTRFFYEVKNTSHYPVYVKVGFGVDKVSEPPIYAFDLADLGGALGITMASGETLSNSGSLLNPAGPGIQCFYSYVWEPVWIVKVKTWYRAAIRKLGFKSVPSQLFSEMARQSRAAFELPVESREEVQRLERLQQLNAPPTSKSHSQALPEW
jgi:hypothetical protein